MNKLTTKILITIMSLSISANAFSANAPYKSNIKEVSENKSDKKLKYDIKISYPKLYNLSNKAVENKINNDIKKTIELLKAPFMKDSKENLNNTEPSFPNNDLSLGFDTIYMSKDIVSILLSESTYFSGAAHSNYEMISLNYDLKTGNRIKLKDMFKPNTNYLKVLSDYSIKDLVKRIDNFEKDNEWIKTGAAPKLENFNSFNITKDSLIINFQNYQVTSYANGPQEVKIPFSALKAILK